VPEFGKEEVVAAKRRSRVNIRHMVAGGILHVEGAAGALSWKGEDGMDAMPSQRRPFGGWESIKEAAEKEGGEDSERTEHLSASSLLFGGYAPSQFASSKRESRRIGSEMESRNTSELIRRRSSGRESRKVKRGSDRRASARVHAAVFGREEEDE
jgi:hypothetical protein